MESQVPLELESQLHHGQASNDHAHMPYPFQGQFSLHGVQLHQARYHLVGEACK